MWITHVNYMSDAHKLILASTSRDLRFFTISSETFFEEFILFGKSNQRTKYEIFRKLNFNFSRCEKCSYLSGLLSKWNGKQKYCYIH
jgi:hypothetical protein